MFVGDLDGAAHEGRSLHGLPKNPLQVPRGILELEALRHAPCEVLKALHRVAPRQSFIRSVQLGICLLQQGAPELSALR